MSNEPLSLTHLAELWSHQTPERARRGVWQTGPGFSGFFFWERVATRWHRVPTRVATRVCPKLPGRWQCGIRRSHRLLPFGHSGLWGCGSCPNQPVWSVTSGGSVLFLKAIESHSQEIPFGSWQILFLSLSIYLFIFSCGRAFGFFVLSILAVVLQNKKKVVRLLFWSKAFTPEGCSRV